jgi:sugar O-acyltransferase (sialic acid O-acetyltransferase NeuD family)
MNIPVIVYGAGGLGREVMQIVRLTLRDEGARPIGYLDDSIAPGTNISGGAVLGGAEDLEAMEEEVALVFGIADPEVKAKLYRRFGSKPNITFPNAIHPKASVSEHVSLGVGIVAASGCFISVDAAIGNCVLLNNGVFIGHDTAVGDFSSVLPLAAISGGVRVGERCKIGIQSAIIQGVSIGDGATVGLGSVVLRDVPEGATVLGNPAKRIL